MAGGKIKNPVAQRLQMEAFKRLAETFLGRKNFSWWAIFYAALLFVVAGWLPDGIAELLKKEWISGSTKIIFSLVVLFVMGFKLKNAMEYKGRVVVESKPSPYVKMLVVFLSPLRRDLKPEHVQEMIKDNSLSVEALANTEWAMPVKAIEYQLNGNSLEFIYVVTSKQTKELMPLFKETIKRLFPDYPNLQINEADKEGIEFEDIKAVFNTVEKIYTEARNKGFKDEDVLVDITSGQATNSIAAAIATLTFGRKFQYVSTRDKKVTSYDVGYFEGED